MQLQVLLLTSAGLSWAAIGGRAAEAGLGAQLLPNVASRALPSSWLGKRQPGDHALLVIRSAQSGRMGVGARQNNSVSVGARSVTAVRSTCRGVGRTQVISGGLGQDHITLTLNSGLPQRTPDQHLDCTLYIYGFD